MELLLDSVAAPINVSGGNHMVPIYVNVIPVIAGNVYTFQYRAGPGIPDPYCIQDDNPGSLFGWPKWPSWTLIAATLPIPALIW